MKIINHLPGEINHNREKVVCWDGQRFKLNYRRNIIIRHEVSFYNLTPEQKEMVRALFT
jgi:hypothetical protein